MITSNSYTTLASVLLAVVAEWYRHRIVAGFVTGSSPVPLKTRRVGQRCTLNLSRAETSSRWCGVVVRRGVPAQVSSTSLDHGSKLRGPSPKALVQLNSATLIFTHSHRCFIRFTRVLINLWGNRTHSCTKALISPSMVIRAVLEYLKKVPNV
ncbi:uncharacterized protein TNCV_623791 [Trichonephila clavipes]|nr:uncharacterized protein TNCV_623791 [Trichonephila clavipes]